MYNTIPQYDLQSQRIVPFVAYEYKENFEQLKPYVTLTNQQWFIILIMIALLFVVLFWKRSWIE